jgi:hypothetical protein
MGVTGPFSDVFDSMSKPEFVGFLHRHPKMEADRNITTGHVVVDKDDWKKVRANYDKYERAYDLCFSFVIRQERGQVFESDTRMFCNSLKDLIKKD